MFPLQVPCTSCSETTCVHRDCKSCTDVVTLLSQVSILRKLFLSEALSPVARGSAGGRQESVPHENLPVVFTHDKMHIFVAGVHAAEAVLTITVSSGQGYDWVRTRACAS